MSVDIDQLHIPGQVGGVMHKIPSNSSLGMDDEEITFDSPNDEAAYYREKYRRVADILEETRTELDEFQASSKELEDELEKELQATERQQADLKERIKRLEQEKDDWKTKHVNVQKMHSSTVSAMQREMDNLRSERDKTLVALRDLEMGNDELERNERVAVSSLLDLESKYNRAIEEKTLLEQEIIRKGEMEEEAQRMKDELRDANDQIAILRDQLARSSMPTPPSSVSVPLSPSRSTHELSDQTDPVEISTTTVEPPSSPQFIDTPTHAPKAVSGLPRSMTQSNIPMLSPSLKRSTIQIPNTPGRAALGRSTTTRNINQLANSTIQSPGLSRSRSGLPQPSPVRNAERKESRTKASKLLHDLQARIRATDDKLGSKVPRRAVSNTSDTAVLKEVKSSSTLGKFGLGPRVAALSAKDKEKETSLRTPTHNVTPAANSILSPNGWVLIGDDMDTTPPAQISGYPASRRNEPSSPLEPEHPSRPPTAGPTSRAVSAASNASRGLPSRPSIPSPLMNLAAQSAAYRQAHANSATPTPGLPLTSSNLAKSTGAGTSRPASRSALHQSIRAPSRSEARPASRAATATAAHGRASSRASMADSRPLSPSMIPRSGARSPGPNTLSALSASVSQSTPNSAARTAERAAQAHKERMERAREGVGRGPPPASYNAHAKAVGLSVSTSTPTGLRKSVRRSSVGGSELARIQGSVGPGGRSAGEEADESVPPGAGGEGAGSLARSTSGRTPPGSKGRPVSVPHFGTPPPEVPRIPSVHLKEKRRTMLQ